MSGIIKNKIVGRTLSNKRDEIEFELECNLLFTDEKIEEVEEMLNDYINDEYLYKVHYKFLKDFYRNGYSRFIKKYNEFCEKICLKNNEGKRTIIPEIEIAKIASFNSTKNKFKKHLRRKANKKINEINKCYKQFNDDSIFFNIQKKIREMEKFKVDLEHDLCDLKRKITPDIFPELSERVEEYRSIQEENDMYFVIKFKILSQELFILYKQIIKLEAMKSRNSKYLHNQLRYLYVEYHNLHDNYDMGEIYLSLCEEKLRDMEKKIEILGGKINEEYKLYE